MRDKEYEDDLPDMNRFALVLEPAEAYLEWAKVYPEADPDLTLDDLCEEGTVYLIPEVEGHLEAWLKRNYKAMFECELNLWCTDDSFWPDDLSFKTFEKFFNIRFCSMVLDMGHGIIKRIDE